MNARWSICIMLATMLGFAGSLTGWGQEREAHKNFRREIERLWELSLAAQQRGDPAEARQFKRQAGELIVAERARLKELAAGIAKDQDSLEKITEKFKVVSQQKAEVAAKRIKIDPDKIDPASQQSARENPGEPSGELKRDLQEKIENMKLAEKHLLQAGQLELASRVRGEIEKVVRMRGAIEKDDRRADRRRDDFLQEAPMAKQPAEKAVDARIEAKMAEAARKIDNSAHEAIQSLRQELENLRAEFKELRAAVKKERQ